MATRQDLDNAIGAVNSQSQILAALALTMQSSIAAAIAVLQVPPPAPIDYQPEVDSLNAINSQMNEALILLQNSNAALTNATPH